MDIRLQRFYRDRLERYGADDPRGLGWRDAGSQETRFKVLTEVGPLGAASVLDEGCGVGDLYGYLRSRFPRVQYLGIDSNPDAIAAARKKFPDAAFETADFAEYAGPGADYVLSSGALTFRIADHESVYREHVRKMFALARKGAAFNVLDKSAIQEDDEYLGYDPDELLAFCRTLTPDVTLRHEYSPEDMTFYLYR